jgi:hypothetical protein
MSTHLRISNYRNQIQTVQKYSWMYDWKESLTFDVPEHHYYPLTFKFAGGYPTLYVLQDELFPNARLITVRFILVQDNDSTLINLAKENTTIRYIGTDMASVVAELDDMWKTAFHCFEVFK